MLGMDREPKDAPEEAASKGEHVTDTVDKTKSGMHVGWCINKNLAQATNKLK